MPTVVQDVSGDSALQNAIAALKAKIEGAEESSDIAQAVSDINTALAGKQNTLTFDSTPSSGSSNPVTSGGVKTALDGKQDTLTFDSAPTDSSTNPVTSGGVYTEVSELKENLTDLQEVSDTKAAAIYETASGSIASFTDGADDMPMKSCVVNIEPIQEGTGDPSPENVRPISGRTRVSVRQSGTNLFRQEKDLSSSGGVDVVKNTDGSFTFTRNDTSSGAYNQYCFGGGNVYDNTIPLIGGKTYVISGVNVQINGITKGAMSQNIMYTASEGDCINAIWFYISTTLLPKGSSITLYPMIIESNTLDTQYIPYADKSNVLVNWETEVGTVYGGTLDVVSGKLTVDRGYIASYNGETLPATWISDRDVYSAGTTPTTGAQVLYELATPTEIQLTPQEIRTLLGKNNVWSDAGSMAVEYPADTKSYIDNKIAEAIAAAMA